MSDNPLVKLLGETVIDSEKKPVPVANLAGEGSSVCLYFSAHWCPPCRAFTPKFADFYRAVKAREEVSDKLVTIFVSSDRSQNDFDSYFKEMPWHALPFDDRDRKEKLSRKFKVQGIPTLVVLDGATGRLVSSNGRSLIADDPEGKDFPWRQKTFEEIVGGSLIENNGTEFPSSDLKGKSVAIYFSAHWCPPCRAFTPDLIKFYEKNHEKLNFELIFVSSDREEDQFKEYFGTMPWKAIPFDDKKRVAELKRMFEVQGIPLLVVVGPDGKLVTKNGRAGVSSDPDGKDFPWAPKPVQKLTSHTASAVNESPCLIYFTEDESDAEKAREAMMPVATKEIDDAKKAGEDPRICFFTAAPDDDDDDDVIDSLTGFLSLGSKMPQLVIVDINDQTVYVRDDANVTEEKVKAFVADFHDGKLSGRKLRG